MVAFAADEQASGPSPGLVLQVPGKPVRYFRVSHCFEHGVYGQWVGGPEGARFAKRPLPMLHADLDRLVSKKAKWGRIPLPSALASEPVKDSEDERIWKAAWKVIKPLVQAMKREKELSRSNYTLLIANRAAATDTSVTTVRRLLQRYYYFGGTRLGLQNLPSGVKPGGKPYRELVKARGAAPRPALRRGPKSIEEKDLKQRNTFVVSEEDIADMVDFHRQQLSNGPTYYTTSQEKYLAGPFKRRHPAVYEAYMAGKHPEPVSVRQYRSYVGARLKLTKELARNARTPSRRPHNLRSLRALGPAEVYEIDATGGRIFLVTGDDPPVHVGKPTIYLIIDRWSRYIPAVYIGLRPPSYEEVRQALLVGFTSRRRRFSALKIDVDEKRWPRGRMPAILCPDRGAEFLSASMEESVVLDLRIDLTPLPPLCPDGKAIVERFIRELKRRMASSGLEGTYADRPLSPQDKRTAKRAEAAAVRTLAEAYRILIEIVLDHNNRPHTALRRMKVLTQAGVEPTPQAAYLWGLTNLTGLRVPPLADSDYQRMLLGKDDGSIANGVVSYKGRAYEPVNETAQELARRSPRRAKAIGLRVDRGNPAEVFVANDQTDWARFRITDGGAAELAGLTLDEEEALAEHNNRLFSRAQGAGKRRRIKAVEEKEGERRGQPKPQAAVSVDDAEKRRLRERETARVKAALAGESNPRAPDADTSPKPAGKAKWQEIEEQERAKALSLIRKKERSTA